MKRLPKITQEECPNELHICWYELYLDLLSQEFKINQKALDLITSITFKETLNKGDSNV